MKNFIVIQFLDRSGLTVGATDYPSNLPTPVVGDLIDMRDDEGVIRVGKVLSRHITVRSDFTEVKLTVM